MATFQQRDDVLRGYVSDIDINQYKTVLLGLQSSENKNIAEFTKMDMELKKIADSQLIRPEAKEYFFKRMRERKDVLEKNMGNFAHANELNYGMQTLYTAVDEKVAMEIHNSTIPSKIQEQYKKLAESKNPQLANMANLEYSMRDINSWANSKDPVGKRFQGNSSYIPYTDIQKVLQDVQKTLPANVYAEINKFGTFSYMSGGKEIKLDANIQRSVDAVINSNEGVNKQVEINAWSQFKGVSDRDLVNYFAKYASSKSNQYDSLKQSHKAFEEGEKLGKRVTWKKDAMMSDEEANDMESASNYYKNQADGYLGMLEKLKRGEISRTEIEKEIYKGELKHNFGNTFAYSKAKDKKIITDQGAIAIYNETNQQDRFNAEMRYKMNKDATDKELEILKAYNKGELNADNLSKMGMSPAKVSEITSSDIKRLATEKGEVPDVDKEVQNVADLQNQNNKALKDLYSDIQLNYGVKLDIASLNNAERDEFFNGLEQSLKDAKKDGFEYKGVQIKENQNLLDHINKIREIRTENTSLNGYVRELAQSQKSDNIDRTKYRVVEKDSPLKFKDNYTPELELEEIATGTRVAYPTTEIGQQENIYNLKRKWGIVSGTEQTNAEIKSQALKAEVIRMGFASKLSGLPSGIENMTNPQIMALMNKEDGIKDFKVVYDSKSKKLLVYGEGSGIFGDGKIGEVDDATITNSNILSRTVNEFRQLNEKKNSNEKIGSNIRVQTYNAGLIENNSIKDPNKYVPIRSVAFSDGVAHVATKQDAQGNIYVGYVVDGEWSPNSKKITVDELYTSEGNERLANIVNEMERLLKVESNK